MNLSKETAIQLFDTLKEEMAKEWMSRSIESFDFGEPDPTWNMQLKTLAAIYELYQFEKEKNVHCTNVLSNRKEECQQDDESTTVDEGESSVGSDEATVISEKDSEEEKPYGIYQFHRNLRGGHLPELNGYLPERVVRTLGLTHGDMVKATVASYQPPSTINTHYDYEFVEKGDLPEIRVRRQVNLCEVEEAGGHLIVRRSNENGLIKLNDDIVQLMINETDRTTFQIVPGDLVDMAFYEDEVTHAKVIWKHRLEDVPEENDKPAKIKSKQKSKQEPANNENKTDLLQGKTILVIGESHRSNYYEFEVHKQGGKLLMADGKQKDLTIRQKVSQADIVVCVTTMCSHKGMESSRDEAKKQNKPFIPVYTNSAPSLVKAAIKEVQTQAV